MPRKSTIHQEKLELAINFLTEAEFSSEDVDNKVLQQKVAQTLKWIKGGIEDFCNRICSIIGICY
jgi:hypothetical protein